jgi:hypothetical protein
MHHQLATGMASLTACCCFIIYLLISCILGWGPLQLLKTRRGLGHVHTFFWRTGLPKRLTHSTIDPQPKPTGILPLPNGAAAAATAIDRCAPPPSAPAPQSLVRVRVSEDEASEAPVLHVPAYTHVEQMSIDPPPFNMYTTPTQPSPNTAATAPPSCSCHATHSS